MDKIKVAQLLPSFHMGGLQVVAISIANGLSELGFFVDLVSLRPDGTLADTASPDIRQIVYQFDSRKSRWQNRIDLTERYLRDESPDAVITNGMLAGTSLIAHERANSDAKLITVCHGEAPKGRIASLIERFSPHRRAEREAAYRASAAIGVSEGLTANCLGMFSPDIRRTIYNPVITPERRRMVGQPFDHPWFERFEANELPVIVTVGRLDSQKNYPLLLRAFSKVRNAVPSRLIIVGGGPQLGRLRRMIWMMGLGECVELAGPQENPFSYMERADLFVLSSDFEGLPTVLIEAMFCGTPVVSTDCPYGPREILQGGRLGALVPVGDADALAAAVIDALRSPATEERRAELRARAELFDERTSVENYARLIEDLVNGRY